MSTDVSENNTAPILREEEKAKQVTSKKEATSRK
jgi:hypothetical protein